MSVLFKIFRLKALRLVPVVVLMALVPATYAHAGVLKSLCEIYFGQTKKSVTQVQLAERDQQIWEQLKPGLIAEIQALRAEGKQALQDRLTQVDQKVSADLARLVGGDGDVGFHYNLNGGLRHQYVEGGGIRASLGDIAVTVGMTRHQGQKQVYFFRLKKMSVRQILEAQNMKVLLKKTRMGNALVIFNPHHQLLEQAKAQGLITMDADILFEFDESKRRQGQFVGVPREAFLLPPLSVFDRYKKILGMSLSWDEETLVAMRYIESYIPATAQP